MPVVSDEKGWAYLHIPKTGGNWVRSVLAQNSLGREIQQQGKPHAYPSHIPDFNVTNDATEGIDLDRYWIFVFVRHPLTWYQSMWCMRTAQDWEGGPSRWPLDKIITDHEYPDFKTFVDWALDNEPSYVSRLYRQFIDDRTGFVGRFENLQDDLCYALHRADEPISIEEIRSIPAVNVHSKRDNSQCQYTRSLASRVVQSEVDAMEKYGYD